MAKPYPWYYKDVDQLTEDEFQALVAGLQRSIPEQRQASPIVWEHTGDGEFPYRAEVRGKSFTIRVNDFPAEPLYTLLIEGEEVEDLDDWPSAWVKPAIPEALLDVVRKTRQPK